MNCSIYAPIINYQLEFKEIPHGRWVVINIPAKIDYDSLRRHGKHRNKRKREKSDVVEFKHTYTIKGLTKGSSYKVSLTFKRRLKIISMCSFKLFRLKSVVEMNLGSVLNPF